MYLPPNLTLFIFLWPYSYPHQFDSWECFLQAPLSLRVLFGNSPRIAESADMGDASGKSSEPGEATHVLLCPPVSSTGHRITVGVKSHFGFLGKHRNDITRSDVFHCKRNSVDHVSCSGLSTRTTLQRWELLLSPPERGGKRGLKPQVQDPQIQLPYWAHVATTLYVYHKELKKHYFKEC